MSKYTRKAITSSFIELLNKKSLDKISVKDIIEAAEINRNTFYYHFEDIYALLDTVFNEEAERFRSETKEGNSFYEEYLRAARFFLSKREMIIHVYNSKSRAVLNNYLEAATCHFVQRYVEKEAEGTGLSDEGIRYITYFYSYAIIGNTMRWVEAGMLIYQENLLLTISQSFEATIQDMIKNYIENHRDKHEMGNSKII